MICFYGFPDLFHAVLMNKLAGTPTFHEALILSTVLKQEGPEALSRSPE